jgi:hypothetical protein
LLEVLREGRVLTQPVEVVEVSVLGQLEGRVFCRRWELIVVLLEILRGVGGAEVANVKAKMVLDEATTETDARTMLWWWLRESGLPSPW